jgi:hypothetical protein
MRKQVRERNVRVRGESTDRFEESVVRKVFEGAVLHSSLIHPRFRASGLARRAHFPPEVTLEGVSSPSGFHVSTWSERAGITGAAPVPRLAAPGNASSAIDVNRRGRFKL